jgi:caffeoyl-CoA O-methyltransferase
VKEPTFLKVMVQKARARRVLEIGTFDGTSALAMAETLPDDGTVLTCEINAGLATLARKRFGRSPHGRKIEVLVGPALETLPGVTGPFDLVFVDADTTNYVHYYHHAMRLLTPAGIILMDNMRGAALGDVDSHGDRCIAAVQELSRTLALDGRVTAELVSIRDGVMVITPKT